MYEEKYTFGKFLGRAWWLFLISFVHAFNNAKEVRLTGSTLGDILISGAIILIILFAYWFIRYGRKQ